MNKKLVSSAILGSLLFAAVVFADVSPTPTPTAMPTHTERPKPLKSPRPTPKPEDIVCAQNAIEKRETAISSAVDQYATAWKAALSARKNALKDAVGLTDKKARKEAVKKAWEEYRKARRTVNKTFEVTKRDAWKQYRKDAKACGGKIDEGPQEEGADNR